MPLPIIAKGALIGGGVGLALAVVRRPAGGQEDSAKLGRFVKSAAEGALAGAGVALVLERSLHRKAADVLVANAPLVIDTVTELAQRYEPAVERFTEAARELTVGALDAARELRVLIDHRIEAVRGTLTDEKAQRIAELWSTIDDGSEQLADVVCVLRDPSDDIVGVNCVHAAEVPLVGDRPFWVYSCRFAPGVPDDAPMAMLGAAYDALAAEFEPPDGGPLGLCWFVADRDFLARHPDAVWPETGLVYAGWDQDGRQLRLRYFHLAAIS